MHTYVRLALCVLAVIAQTPTPEDANKVVQPSPLKPSETVVDQIKIIREDGKHDIENSWKNLDGIEDAGGNAGSTPESFKEPDEKLIEQTEQQAFQSNQTAMLNSESEWLKKERRELLSLPAPSKKEQFHFTLPNEPTPFLLVLDLHNSTDDDNKILLEVKVFSDEGGNSFVEPNRPAESTSLSLRVRFSPGSNITALDRSIYMHGRYSLQFRPVYYLEFTNNYDRRLYVMVAVEMMKRTVREAAAVQSLAGRLGAVADKQKSQRITFKWQMGFRQMGDQHQSILLALTSVELVCIVLTTLIQVACIKKLMDNRSLV